MNHQNNLSVKIDTENSLTLIWPEWGSNPMPSAPQARTNSKIVVPEGGSNRIGDGSATICATGSLAGSIMIMCLSHAFDPYPNPDPYLLYCNANKKKVLKSFNILLVVTVQRVKLHIFC